MFLYNIKVPGTIFGSLVHSALSFWDQESSPASERHIPEREEEKSRVLGKVASCCRAHCLLLHHFPSAKQRTELLCCPSADLTPHQVFSMCARTFAFLPGMVLMLILSRFCLPYPFPRSTVFLLAMNNSDSFKTGGFIF